MPVIHATQVIERPIDEVFAPVADAGNFHYWNPTITSARRLSDAGMTLGAKFEWKLRGFGTVSFRNSESLKETSAFGSCRISRVCAAGSASPFARQGSATRIDHELEMLPTGWFRLVGPVMGMIGRRNLRDTTQALQKYLESRPQGERKGETKKPLGDNRWA